MEKKNKWMTKRNMAIVGLVGFLAICLMLQRPVGYFLYETCKNSSLGEMCMNTVNYLELFFLFLSVLFIPSVISLSHKNNEVFEFWKKTLFVYLIVYLFIIIVTPDRLGGSGDWPAIGRGFFAFLSAVLYSLISIVLVVYKSLEKNS